MKDDLRLMGIATRIFHGRPTDREDAEAIRQATTRFTDRIAALEAKLAEKDALLRECGEALDGMLEYSMFNEAWQDKHPEYRTKAANTLAKIKDATDAD